MIWHLLKESGVKERLLTTGKRAPKSKNERGRRFLTTLSKYEAMTNEERYTES